MQSAARAADASVHRLGARVGDATGLGGDPSPAAGSRYDELGCSSSEAPSVRRSSAALAVSSVSSPSGSCGPLLALLPPAVMASFNLLWLLLAMAPAYARGENGRMCQVHQSVLAAQAAATPSHLRWAAAQRASTGSALASVGCKYFLLMRMACGVALVSFLASESQAR